MPSTRQVTDALAGGADYAAAGRRLGIPPGRAYLIATGHPADRSPDISPSPESPEPAGGGLGSRAQALVNPREVNPTAREDVAAWMKRRAHADGSMRRGGKGAP